MTLRHGLQLFADAAVGFLTGFFDLADLLRGFFQRFFNRFDEVFNGLFALFQIGGSGRVMFLKILLGQLQFGQPPDGKRSKGPQAQKSHMGKWLVRNCRHLVVRLGAGEA